MSVTADLLPPAEIEPREARTPRYVLVLKALIYMAAALFFIGPLATGTAWATAAAGAGLGVMAARWAERARLRLSAGLLIAVLIAGTGWLGSEAILGSTWIANGLLGWLSTSALLHLSDGLFFGLITLGVVAGLRLSGDRVRPLSALEAAVVVASMAWMVSGHRNQMIHRPRLLSDWAWSNGVDPQTLLKGLGVCVAGLGTLVLLRASRAAKVGATLIALLATGWLVYHFAEELDIKPEVHTNGLNLTGGEQGASSDDQDGESSSGQSGGQGDGESKEGQGNNNDPYSGDFSSNNQPDPVAVAVFHEDYEPPGGLLYFRQQVLSWFDGNHLVSDPQKRFDQDVFVDFPTDAPVEAPLVQSPDFHVEVPTSMFLLVDHPQPFALTNSVKLEPLTNPAPNRFVSAYGVTSRVLSIPLHRLSGRRSVPDTWTEAQKAHYLQVPDDPRYGALSDLIVRDIDPRFVGDDMMKALMIKQYLEQNGFYTRKETHKDTEDPTASFLFGSLRGYCVHFAHSAVHLLRSQGIAARVAIGYAVDMKLRGGGSAVLVMADRAHAWPEVHVDGVGWVTFDIYPQQSDEPVQRMVAPQLESIMGELARNDPTGGMGDPDATPFSVPWALIGRWLLLLLLALLALAYAVKIGRRLAAGSASAAHQRVFAATLDRFSDVGAVRRPGESRERYAQRLASLSPSLEDLTLAHLGLTLGAREGEAPPSDRLDRLRHLSRQVQAEYARNISRGRRVLGWLNPVGWWFTR